MGSIQPKKSPELIYEKISNFSGGINVEDQNTKMGDFQLRELINCELGNNGELQKRTGYKTIFNFKNSPLFFNIFNPNDIKTTIKIPLIFPSINNTYINNIQASKKLSNYLQSFLIQGFRNNNIKLTLKWEDLSSNNVTFNMLDNKWFNYDPSDNIINVNNIKSGKYLNVGKNITGNIIKDNFSKNWFNYITTGNYSQDLPVIDITKINVFNLNIILGYNYNNPDNKNNYINFLISGLDKQFNIPTNEKINLLGNFILEITIDPNLNINPTSFKTEKIVPFQKDSNSILYYIVSIQFEQKLYFISIAPDENGDYNIFNLLKWYLIDNRYYKDNNVYYGKVNEYLFINNHDSSGNIISKKTVNITTNNPNDFYYDANDPEKDSKGNIISNNPNFFVGVDMVQWKDKLYIATGYGILECTEEDIKKNTLFEIIPYKPSSIDYSTKYSNLLVSSKKINFSNLISRGLSYYDGLWNWDWVDYPKTDWISGIISKYPPNSLDSTKLRGIINFSNELNYSTYTYNWTYINAKGIETDDGKGYINYSDYLFSPINQERTINLYAITDNNIISENSSVPQFEIFTNEIEMNRESIVNNNYIFNTNSQKIDLSKFATTYKNLIIGENEISGLSLGGDLNFPFRITSNAFDIVFMSNYNISNIAIQLYINGNVSDWINLDGFYSINENDSASTSLEKAPLLTVNLKNTVAVQQFLKQNITKDSPAFTPDNCNFIFRASASYYAADIGAFNAKTKWGIKNPATSGNSLLWTLTYKKPNPNDNATITLTPQEDLEKILYLDYIATIKECKKLQVINQQLFLYGSKTNKNLIWYSDISNPNYFPIANTIILPNNDIIQKIKPFGSNYLVFGLKCIYLLTQVKDGFSIELANSDNGCMFPDSITGIGGNIIFLGTDGFYLITSAVLNENHKIRLTPIDRTIKKLLYLNKIKNACAISIGQKYQVFLEYEENEYNQILKYNLNYRSWSRDISNNVMDFVQYENIFNSIYTLGKNGIWNYWYNQNDVENLLNIEVYKLSSEEFLNRVTKLYSDGFEVDELLGDNLLNTKLYPIEFRFKTAELSGIGKYIHNYKRFKQVQIKHINTDFFTNSYLNWYVDNNKIINTNTFIYGINENGAFSSILKDVPNLIHNAGAWIGRSFIFFDKNLVTNQKYITKFGDNREENIVIKKGSKGYTQEIEIYNKEPLPFGIKSINLVYKMDKAK